MRLAATLWTLALAVLAAGALLASGEAPGALAAFDRAGLAFAESLRAGWLDRLMLTVTWLGSLWLLVPLAGLAAWRLWRAQRVCEAAFVVAALLGAAALSRLAKLWAMRPRPDLFPSVLDMPADWSYPSGHAMQAAALALALFFVLKRWRAGGGVLLACVVLLVAASRVYLQVHFPSDVIAGIVAAGLWTAGLHARVLRRPQSQGRRA